MEASEECCKVSPAVVNSDEDEDDLDDRMSGQHNDVILLLHAPDGSRWSQFLASRLEIPPYEITCIDKDLTILEGPPEEDDDDNNEDNGDNGKKKEEEKEVDEEDTDLYLNTSEIVETVNAVRSGSCKSSDGNNNNSSGARDRSASGTGSALDRVNFTQRSDSGIGSSCSGTSSTRNSGEERTDNGDEEENNNDGSVIKEAAATSPSVTLTDASSVDDCILYSRACIIFLSPDIIEGESEFPIDITLLNPACTVFLFLGVDSDEVRHFFGARSEIVFRCRLCHIDGTDVTIRDALMEIVKAYENPGRSSGEHGVLSVEADEEDVDEVYKLPNSVQMNRVEKVFPRDLTGEDREVYIQLQHNPEHDVVVEIGASQAEVPLKRVGDRLFSFTVPDNLNGKVSFVVGSRGYKIGSESVRIMSRLDQLVEILTLEVDPKTLLAKAVGVSPDDEGGIDTALAFRLQQLASARTFAQLFPVEEKLRQEKNPSPTSLYPSLLHFAADNNLRTFCSELLRYPGMAGAISQENKDGETPGAIADRKQFKQLQTDLDEFARRHGHLPKRNDSIASTASSNDELYVQPSPPSGPPPPPPPHRPSPSKSSGYVNTGVEHYMDMQDLPGKSDLINVHHQLSHIESSTSSPLAGSHRQFRNDFEEDDEGSRSPLGYQNLESYRAAADIRSGGRTNSTKSSPGGRENSPVPRMDSPQTVARKALKVLGTDEKEIQRSSGLLLHSKSSSVESDDQTPIPERNRFWSGSTPRGLGLQKFNDASYNSNVSLNQLDGGSEKSSKGRKMAKIKSMLPFGKGKGKRSSSISSVEGQGIKYLVSDRGNKRRGSEGNTGTIQGSNPASLKKKEATEERDSGSYSDEEQEKLEATRRSNKHKTFKDREKAMTRRMSRRERAVLQETIEVAPTLPSRPKKRGGFKSFIDDNQ